MIAAISLNFMAMGQGCSDAGVCSFDAHGMEESTPRSSVGIYLGTGLADEAVSVNSVALGLKLMLTEDIAVVGRMPFQAAFGKGYSVTGIGDPFAALSVDLYEDSENKTTLGLLVGGRFAVGETDARDTGSEDIPLPMPYQPGLGTNDILARITLGYEEWTFAVGYQQPFGETENEFIVGASSDLNEYDGFFSSRHLERGADLSIRIDYSWVGEDITYRAGILPIIRLQESKITVAPEQVVAFDAGQVNVDDSMGITFNITGGLTTELSEDLVLNTDIGFPVMVRKNRPDGLTRAFQLNVGLDYLFDL